MTKFIFIRHGEADYEPVDQKGFVGQGRDLASLSQTGINQIKETAKNDVLKGSDIIISSPYARALQSAAILSRKLDLEIEVEVDLHEWIPDIVNFADNSTEVSIKLYRDYDKHNGIHPIGEEKVWESNAQIISRIESVLEKYSKYRQVIVVSHGMVISTQNNNVHIKNGEIVTLEKF